MGYITTMTPFRRTAKGNALQLKVQAGLCKLEITGIKIGNGLLEEGQTIEELTDLISPITTDPTGNSQTLPIATVTGIEDAVDAHGNPMCMINTLVRNGNNESTRLTEYGVYARDTDGSNILYGAINYGSDNSMPFPTYDGQVPIVYNLSFPTYISNMASIEAALSFIISRNNTRTATLVIGNKAAGHTVYECDYLCDGTNDSAVINAAIAAMPECGGKIILREGTYYISEPIKLENDNAKHQRRISLEGMGMGATILYANTPPASSGSGDRSVIYAWNTSYITVRDMTIQTEQSFESTEATWLRGIEFTGGTTETSRSIIERCEVKNFDVGISAGGHGVRVINCRTEGNLTRGITAAGSNYGSMCVSMCLCPDGIEVGGGQYRRTETIVSDCRASEILVGGRYFTVTNCAADLITVTTSTGNTFISGNVASRIVVENSWNCKVSNNRVYGENGNEDIGIQIGGTNTNHCEITNNTVCGHHEKSIYLTGATQSCLVAGNVVSTEVVNDATGTGNVVEDNRVW